MTGNDGSPRQSRLPHIGQGEVLRLPERPVKPFISPPSYSSLHSMGSLKSISFTGQPTPPLTPPQHDYNPFGIPSQAPLTMSTVPSKMNALALRSLFRSLDQRSVTHEEDVSSLWADILSTVTNINSPSAHILEEQSAASRHDVTSYMTYAVCTQADWLNHHNSINLIMYNHHDATSVGKDPNDYGTWQPVISKMTAWLRERHHAYDNFLSQPTFGVIAAGSTFMILMLYSGSERAYGEPGKDGNVRIRDLTDKTDQGVLRLLLEHVGNAEPARKEDTGFDMEMTWVPLEVGREEDATFLNSGRRDSRSEQKKPALSALARKSAAG